MKIARVYNQTTDEILLEKAGLADTFILRLKGLIGKKNLHPGEGLVIKPCSSIHTIGMSFPIDVAFVDKKNRICYMYKNMHPFQIGKTVRGAKLVIEGKVGLLSESEIGDLIRVEVLE